MKSVNQLKRYNSLISNVQKNNKPKPNKKYTATDDNH